MAETDTPKRLTKKERLKLTRAQIDAQLRDIATAEKQRQREIEDSRKFAVGGHFLQWIKDHPDDPLSRGVQSNMEEHLRGRYYRELLGLSPRPDLAKTSQQKHRAAVKAATVPQAAE
jgi:hypothetical protein